MKKIEKAKKEFLGVTRVGDAGNAESKRIMALAKSISAAMQGRSSEGRIYEDAGKADSAQKREFRECWGRLVCDISAQYSGSISEAKHCQNIASLSKQVSKKHGGILKDGRLRIGMAQKSLNLYLKYLWCLSEVPMPPHCTVDGIVLRAAGVHGSWTKCDSIEEYKRWIGELKKHAKKHAGTDKLAEWEILVW